MPDGTATYVGTHGYRNRRATTDEGLQNLLCSSGPRKERALPDNPSKTGRRDTRRRFEQWARNPTCQANTLSAVHNVPMAEVAKADGTPPTMGQSPFAIARGQAFERSLYRGGGQAMFQALKESEVLPESASGLEDLRLRMNGGRLRQLDEALEATAGLLRAVAGSNGSSDGPWLAAGATVSVPGGVMLPEAILVLDALAIDRSKTPPRLIVGEIKTYPDRGGYTDPAELATARAQAGVYVHGLQLVVVELGLGGALDVAKEGFLVLTRPGFNRPSVRAGEDLKYQAERARRGFGRLREAALGLPRGSGTARVEEIRGAEKGQAAPVGREAFCSPICTIRSSPRSVPIRTPRCRPSRCGCPTIRTWRCCTTWPTRTRSRDSASRRGGSACGCSDGRAGGCSAKRRGQAR